jgi:hypothetical protein
MQTYGRASRSSAIVAFPLRQRKEVTSGDKDNRYGGMKVMTSPLAKCEV